MLTVLTVCDIELFSSGRVQLTRASSSQQGDRLAYSTITVTGGEKLDRCEPNGGAEIIPLAQRKERRCVCQLYGQEQRQPRAPQTQNQYRPGPLNTNNNKENNKENTVESSVY